MIERQDLDDESRAYVERMRAYHRGEAEVGADEYLEPKDRRDRADVLGPHCRVKVDDDVQVRDRVVVRVIGPARGEGNFYGLVIGQRGPIDVPFVGTDITDRAPADEGEQAMPVFDDQPDTREPEVAEPDADGVIR